MNKSLKTANIFSSNMVLQQGKNIRIWGEGRENSQVTVSINGHKITSKVIECKWNMEVPSMEYGGPYVMTITDGAEEIIYQNIMIGEVWFAGGQSNMEMALANSLEGEEEAKKADNASIRFYNAAKIATLMEQDLKEEQKHSWTVMSSSAANDMSAVAYYFAKEVSKILGITVGIIDCYWGGSSISCWVDKEFIENDFEVKQYLDEWNEKASQMTAKEYEAACEEFDRAYLDWIQKNNKLRKEEPSITWQEVLEKIGNCPWERPIGYKSPYRPAGLYYTMVQRVMPYTIKGFLWYQGETDENKPYLYDKMLSHLIALWRDDWKDETLPFYIVQLPMWIEKGKEDTRDWAVLRDKQRKVADTIKNTYLTVLIDCGEFDNIHPLDKQIVGERLALQTLKYSYKYKKLCVDSPKYLQRDLKGDKIVLYFDHVDGGFVVKGDEAIKYFEVAGEDKKFMPAKAVIVGETIEVSSEFVKNPKYARYAWVNYGIVNLFNAEGFPVAPFATK